MIIHTEFIVWFRVRIHFGMTARIESYEGIVWAN